MTCLFLSGTENLKYKQLNTELKNNYIIGLYDYPQYLPAAIKILSNYILESVKSRSFRNNSGK